MFPNSTATCLAIPDFLAGRIVVRIVERSAVGLNRPGSEDRVVEDTLHAVAVSRILGDAKQVACDLEVPVGAARRLKAGVSERKTVAELAGPGFAKCFIRTPSAGGEALRLLSAFRSRSWRLADAFRFPV